MPFANGAEFGLGNAFKAQAIPKSVLVLFAFIGSFHVSSVHALDLTLSQEPEDSQAIFSLS